MRKILILMVILFCVVVIQGCGIAYQQNAEKLSQTAKAEDYGLAPTDYENAIKSFMEIILVDPESARYSNWKEPYQRIIPSKIASTEPILGWGVDVYINSKNRMGGYVGAKKYSFFFIDNKIYAYGEAVNGGVFWDWVNK